jgi:hypothetical protein
MKTALGAHVAESSYSRQIQVILAIKFAGGPVPEVRKEVPSPNPDNRRTHLESPRLAVLQTKLCDWGYWPSDSVFDQGGGGVHHKLLLFLIWMGSFACHWHRHQVQGTSVSRLIRRTRAIEVKQLAQRCKQTQVLMQVLISMFNQTLDVIQKYSIGWPPRFFWKEIDNFQYFTRRNSSAPWYQLKHRYEKNIHIKNN